MFRHHRRLSLLGIYDFFYQKLDINFDIEDDEIESSLSSMTVKQMIPQCSIRIFNHQNNQLSLTARQDGML